MSNIDNENSNNTISGYLGSEFQLKLMWQILVEPEFAEKTIPLLSVEYFDDPALKKLFIIMLQYFNDNENKVPNLQNQSINLAIQKYKSPNDPIEEEVLLAIINKINLWNNRVINKDMLNDGDVVQRETFVFFKQQEYRKLSEFIQSKVKSGDIKNKNFIVEVDDKVRKIDTIGDDEDYGIVILDDIDDALKDEFRETIPTGIQFLDDITGGGLGKGETAIVLSPSGYGKTTLLTKIANTAVNDNRNVLQIIFEDTPNQIRRKHFAIWSKIQLSLFKGNGLMIKERILSYFKENKQGQLIIKRFIEDETTIPQIKKWIERYQKKFGIKFDLLVLDYLDCVESHKKTSDPNEAEKAIIKSFMAMGAELDIPSWTAVQGGRASFSAEILEAGHIGGSIKRVQKTHLLISIAKTPEQKENDLANIKIIKARFAKDGQEIKDCIFNNDTMEIRATDNSWKTTLKKYDEKDLETIDEKVNKLHAEISQKIDDGITPNTEFDNQTDIVTIIEEEDIKKPDSIIVNNKSYNVITHNINIKPTFNDVDEFIKKLNNGELNSNDKNNINNLLNNS